MVDVITSVLSASNLPVSLLDSCRVVSAPYGDIIRVTPDRLLGTTPLDVEVTVDAVEQLTTRLAMLEARLEAESNERKAADSVLQRSQLRGPLRVVAAQLAQMAFKSPQEFQRLADDVITRRNNDGGHWTLLTALEDEVQSLQDLLRMAPEQKQTYKSECWVVENYDVIKQAFPAQFSSADSARAPNNTVRLPA